MTSHKVESSDSDTERSSFTASDELSAGVPHEQLVTPPECYLTAKEVRSIFSRRAMHDNPINEKAAHVLSVVIIGHINERLKKCVTTEIVKIRDIFDPVLDLREFKWDLEYARYRELTSLIESKVRTHFKNMGFTVKNFHCFEGVYMVGQDRGSSVHGSITARNLILGGLAFNYDLKP